eukprot:2810900-Amphidinium_carterae.3
MLLALEGRAATEDVGRVRHGEVWGAVPFTPVFKTNSQGTAVRIGYQVVCKHPHHADETRKACQKTCNFNISGGEEQCRRQLKHWMICGLRAKTREEHQQMWKGTLDVFKGDDPPSMDVLDRQTIVSFEAAIAALHHPGDAAGSGSSAPPLPPPAEPPADDDQLAKRRRRRR